MFNHVCTIIYNNYTCNFISFISSPVKLVYTKHLLVDTYLGAEHCAGQKRTSNSKECVLHTA